MKHIILSLSILCLVIGCAAELTLQGSKVKVGAESEIKQCQLLGSTRVSLASLNTQLMTTTQIKNYLITEARNFAARIGGNFIFPMDSMKEGKQSFSIYNCPIVEHSQ